MSTPLLKSSPIKRNLNVIQNTKGSFTKTLDKVPNLCYTISTVKACCGEKRIRVADLQTSILDLLTIWGQRLRQVREATDALLGRQSKIGRFPLSFLFYQLLDLKGLNYFLLAVDKIGVVCYTNSTKVKGVLVNEYCLQLR